MAWSNGLQNKDLNEEDWRKFGSFRTEVITYVKKNAKQVATP
jgi:hypothetical protein